MSRLDVISTSPPLATDESLASLAARVSDQVLDCAAITGCFAFLVWLLQPLQDMPFVDDATYAWSVEWLLKTGQLRILEFSSNIHPLLTLWGALLCLPAVYFT